MPADLVERGHLGEPPDQHAIERPPEAVLVLDPVGVEGDPYLTGFGTAVGVGAGRTGERDRYVGAEQTPGTGGHLRRALAADGSRSVQRLVGDVQERPLRIEGVGHRGPEEVGRGAGDGRDAFAQTAAGEGLGARERAPKNGIAITDAAVTFAKEKLAKRGTPDAAIRLGIKGGGCSGFSYVIQFEDEAPKPRDYMYEADGVRFIVDKKSFVYLAGTVFDYEKTLMFQGFKFRNPQEAASCGCGHSFTVR